MSDEQQNQTADAEGAAGGADEAVTNAAAADVEAALNDETLEDQAQGTAPADEEGDAEATAEPDATAEAGEDSGSDDEDGAAAAAEEDATAKAGEDSGPDVEPDEEGVADVKEHSTKLLGGDEDEGAGASPLRVPPGVPSGIDPGTLADRDTPAKPGS